MKRDAEPLVIEGSARAVAEAGLRRVAWAMLPVFAWVIAWYWGTARDIVRIWWGTETFAHGLVVLPIFAWLVWRRRERIVGLAPQPVPWLAVPAALAGLLWLVGDAASIASMTHFALLGLLETSLVGVLGWRLARVLAFPLLFLVFAVPFGDFLIPTLIHYTADFTVAALRLTGVPVLQEGTHLVVPNGRWSVVEACSGIRYLIASLMVGSLYAWLNYTSVKRRLLFMVAATLVPLVANWIRAYLIVLLGYLSDNRIATGVDHIIYGWVFFGIVISILFWIGGRWREEGVTPAAAATEPAPLAAPPRWWRLAPLAAVVAAFPLIFGARAEPTADFSVPLVLPGPAAGWTPGPAADTFGYQPHLRGFRAEEMRTYRDGNGGEVALYVAYFARQQAGHELVMWGNELFPSVQARWAVLGAGAAQTSAGPVVRLVATDGVHRLAVWQWYRVGEEATASVERARFKVALARLLGRPDDSAFVAVMTQAGERPNAAQARLARFVAAHGAALDDALARAGKRQ